MPASSLSRLARKTCERNLHMITDLGDAPYEVVKPLLKLTDPHQLHELEQSSPQLIGRDVEVWKMFIKRDVMQSHKLEIAPEDPTEWYSIYQALLNAQEERLANADAALRNVRYNAETEKNKHAAIKVELSAVKPPPGSRTAKDMIRMTREERRHLREPTKGKFGQSEYRSKGAAKQPAEAVAKPKSKLTKIRKAAVQMNRVFNTPANRTQTQTGQRQVTRAPASFIEQHRTLPPRPNKPALQTEKPIKSRKRRIEETEPEDSDDFVAQRKRMKAAVKQSPPPAAKQSIKSVADICKASKVDSTGCKSDSKTQDEKVQNAPKLSPSPPSASRQLQNQSLLASKSNPGPSPFVRPKKAPVDIFMSTKRKRVL